MRALQLKMSQMVEKISCCLHLSGRSTYPGVSFPAFPARLPGLICAAMLLLGASGGMSAAQPPLFRHVDAALAGMTLKPVKTVRFLVSDDFPPFTYRNAAGALTGYSIAVAQAICAEARIRCTFVIRPWERLRSALLAGQGDVIAGGVRMDSAAFAKMDFTRPYLKAMGRFAVRKPSPLTAADAGALAGRRIGVIKGSIHARWIRAHYARSRIQPYDTLEKAREALRTARIDTLFDDWLRMAYWVSGRASRDCCQLLPGWFVERDFAWNDLAMAVRRGDGDLRRLLDQKMDALQADGRLAALAARFLPFGAAEAGK